MWRVMEIAALLPAPAYALPTVQGLPLVSLNGPETGCEAQSCAVNHTGKVRLGTQREPLPSGLGSRPASPPQRRGRDRARPAEAWAGFP